jgi:hypothetical protein
VIRLIFALFRELGSARQVLLSMRADQIHFPRPSDEGRMTTSNGCRFAIATSLRS